MFKQARAAGRGVLGSQHIPYVSFADEETVVLAGGELLSILEIEGLPFETADMDDINAHDRMINALMLNTADEHVMLWSMIIRRRVSEYPEGQFDHTFAQRLDDRYRHRLNRTELFRTGCSWRPSGRRMVAARSGGLGPRSKPKFPLMP